MSRKTGGTGAEPEHGAAAGRSAPEGMPRWVKRFLIAMVVLLVVMVVVMAAVGGKHGPGRHLSSLSTAAGAVALLNG